MNLKPQTMFTGDNLPIMRGMDSESIDLIYLDPPFNSKKQWSAPIGSKAAGAAFKDAWTLSDIDKADLGIMAEERPRSQIDRCSWRCKRKGRQVLPVNDGSKNN